MLARRAPPPAALLLLLLALAAPWRGALAQDECLTNPTLPACVAYTVPNEVLKRELSKLCASAALGGRTYSGWPSACSLWHECQEGRAGAVACRPLALLQTGCSEAITTGRAADVCMTYMTLCAPQSVVAQCQQQPTIAELLPAMQYHTAVQQLCPAGANASAATGTVTAQDLPMQCRNCSALSFDPDMVTVQALEANCPDPLGTLASLCLERSTGMREDSCASWAELCASEAGQGFPGLCGGDVAAPAPAPSPAGDTQTSEAPAPAPAPGVAAVPAPAPPERAGAAGIAGPTAGPTCYADPTQDSCRAFQHADVASEADVRQLCGSTPSMTGCSLWQQCSSGGATGSYCQPFSLLGSICLPNPAVSGCQGWAALCSTAGSVVQECSSAAPVRNVPMTTQTLEAVVIGCSSQSGASVAGCQQCTAAAGACSDPLAVMSRLCQEDNTPTLPQCTNLATMCEEAGATFTALCSGQLSGGGIPASSGISEDGNAGGSGDASGAGSGGTPATGSNEAGGSTLPAGMNAYLHASMSAMILFQSWVPSSAGAYVASCLAIMATAVAVQALKAVQLQLESRWAAQRAAAKRATLPGVCNPASSPEFGSSPTFGGRTSLDGTGDHRRSSHISAPMLWRSSLGRLVSSAGSPTHRQLAGRHNAQPYITRQELARNAARSLFTGAVVWLDYMLMLVVMTFNLGLILSATLGFCLGALAFGHWGERAAAAHAAAAAASLGGVGRHSAPSVVMGSLQPTSENDLEIHYIAPQLLTASHPHPVHQHQAHMHLPPLPVSVQPPILSFQ